MIIIYFCEFVYNNVVRKVKQWGKVLSAVQLTALILDQRSET
jgi:hypothetical protein